MIPGEILAAAGEVELNEGQPTLTLLVANTGDRPIQVGSHYHFFETNEALKFDRKRAKGMRLDIAAGTAVRFEPGQSRTVRLTPYLGSRESHGFQAKVSGKLGPVAKVGPSNEGPTRISRAAWFSGSSFTARSRALSAIFGSFSSRAFFARSTSSSGVFAASIAFP